MKFVLVLESYLHHFFTCISLISCFYY